MKKRLFSVLLTGILCLGLTGGTAVFSEEAAKTVPDAVVIPAADAVFTEGKGVSFENEKVETALAETEGLIVNLEKGGEIVYTVPEGVSGAYDIYLTVSKIMAQFTSQPFSFSINGGDVFSVPIDCQVPADSPAVYNEDGAEYNTGTITDEGRFLIKTGVELNAGDEIKVIASFGAKAPNLKGVVFPGVGELTLAPAGTEVPVGYDYTIPVVEETDPSDPLSGLTILWVGSSVTYGAQAGGHYSMVDAIQDNHAATICEKYAISATTLVNQSEESYVARLKLIPKDKTPDLIVVQLSTNDATTNKPFGEIAEGFEMDSFDDTTIAGAIETIIAYAKETFNCPVVFYTGSYCEKEHYSEMVQLLLDIQAKWGIGVVDMFNNEEMTAIYGTDQYNLYMHDEVHPYRLGYVEWWTPVFEKDLADFLAQ